MKMKTGFVIKLIITLVLSGLFVSGTLMMTMVVIFFFGNRVFPEVAFFPNADLVMLGGCGLVSTTISAWGLRLLYKTRFEQIAAH
jgi:hypothetical protein